MRTHRLLERWRQERDPLYRAMIGLSAVLLALAGIALGVAGCLMAFSWGWSQYGPGGLLSAVRVGQPAPEFTLATLDGRTVSLSDYRGAPVAVNFWATWCLPCVVEIPELSAAVEDYADAGLVVLGVNVGESPERIAPFAARHGIAYDVLLDSKAEVWNRYGGVDWPTTVWIDAVGVIQAADYGKVDRRRIAERMATLAAFTSAP